MIGSGSSQGPSHLAEEGLSYPIDTQPLPEQERKEAFSSSNAEQPDHQHQPDLDKLSTNSAQEPPHEQDESLIDSNSVQQSQVQQHENLNNAEPLPPQQHLLEDVFGSTDA